MYERILVALDGSPEAEAILPHVQALAERFQSRLTLLRATTSPAELVAEFAVGAATAAPIVDPESIIRPERQEAVDYLVALANRLASQGLDVAYEQPEGPAAQVIVQRARELPADLIALTTHGRGGIGRALFGSVADEVLKHAPCPVLLVRIRHE